MNFVCVRCGRGEHIDNTGDWWMKFKGWCVFGLDNNRHLLTKVILDSNPVFNYLFYGPSGELSGLCNDCVLNKEVE